MKKAFDQTFRDIKRGVNKKVLKVPSIEQKVLDATSNESWGPHGTHLADIAQASRNYHDYQMIMAVVWKRLNDSGKNWRHVFKALTILEYLVANGSERVIEDIREHAYQITTLSSFQYIDSTGRDQGSNVRKKSQSLVALVMDKEKIQEAREKATASRDKFRNAPGGTGDEGRYGNNREEDRNGYGREREWDDEYRGRSTSNDGDYGPRSQSSDREREDDGHRSSRGSSARVEDASPDASRVEPKLSGQSPGAPPSYEDAVSGGGSPVVTKRDGETATAIPSKPSSPQVNIDHQETLATTAPPPPAAAVAPPPATTTPAFENEGFNLFDPRGAPAPAPAPPASGGAEMDLLGSLSDSFSSNALALVPSTSITTEIPPPTNTNPYLTFDTASTGAATQPFDDPFGDGPFRAIPSTEGFSATSPFGEAAGNNNFGFGESFDQSVDILADILPPPGPSSQTATQPSSTQTIFPPEPNQTPFGQPPSPAAQPMPHHAFPPQSMPQPSQSLPLQVQGSQQSMPPSAFQVPGGQQSMPLSAFQVPGGQQSMPQPAFQVPGGPQTMPLPALQVPGGQQSMPQPNFPAQAGQSVLQPGLLQAQFMLQPGFAPQGSQNASVSGFASGFPSSNGHSMAQPGFLAQGMFHPAQGSQSLLQPGFPAHGGQNASLGGFPTNGQLARPNVSLSQTGFTNSKGQLAQPDVSQAGFTNSNGQPAQPNVSQVGFINSNGQHAQPNLSQAGFTNSNGQPAQPPVSQAGFTNSNGQPAQPPVSQAGFTNSSGQPNNLYAGFQPPLSQVTATPAPQYNPSNFYQHQQQQPPPGLSASTGALALVPQQPTDKKFETKSTVWTDTLNRGLVNLNISGAKTNPLSDIGIDFDAINRKEKRMEKPSKTPVTSNVAMGKAMGSGSGMGRAGAGVLRPAPTPMVGPGMGAPAGYGGVNQPVGINHVHQPQNMGMGMGMNMGQGFQNQPGFPPSSAMPGTYNPMMGRGVGYGQQPYGGYR